MPILDRVPKPFRWLFLLYTLLELPLCFLGYGSDEDTYGVLSAGRSTWHNHVLATSRNPGYWVYETCVYWLNLLGGSIAVNFAAFLMGGFILWRVMKWGQRFPGAAAAVAGFAFLLVPVFQIAASSGDDYLWSLSCIVLLVESFLDGRYLKGALWGALAMAIRGGNSMVLGGVYAGLLLAVFLSTEGAERTRTLLKVVGCGVLTVVLGLLPYTLSFHLVHDLSFLQPMMGDPRLWTFKVRTGKFVYKLSYLLGPLATIILLAGAVWFRRKFRVPASQRTAQCLCLGALAGNLVMYYKFPLEISYVLPGTLFALLFLSLTLFRNNRGFVLALLAGMVVFNCFSYELLRGNNPGLSTKATLTFDPHASSLVDDIRERWLVHRCDSHPCWVTTAGGENPLAH